MKKYEYKLLNIDVKGLTGGIIEMDEMSHQLNILGQEGWELVEILGTNASYGATRKVIAVFKREIN